MKRSEAQRVRVVVASLHLRYDTRIGNHLKLLVGEGYDVVYVNWSKSSIGLPSGLESVRLVHRHANEVFGVNALRFAAMLLWFLVQILRLRPRLVHLHDVVLLPLVPPIKALLRTRVVFDAHEHYCRLPGALGLFSRLSYRLFLPLVDGVVGVSPSTLPEHPGPSAVVANYQRRSDFERYRTARTTPDEIRLVYFGCLSTLDRDVALLLDTASALLERCDTLWVRYGGRLCGPGAEAFRARFEQLRRDYPDRFVWFEEMAREAVLRETAAADIGLLLTTSTLNLHGSNPNKVFEYFAAGVVVVATDGFLVAPEVQEAGAGLLVPPGIAAEQLVLQLLPVLEDRTQLARMKRASRQLGEQYRWEVAEEGYRQVYRQLGVVA